MLKERLLWTGRIHFHDCRRPQRFAVVNNRRGEREKKNLWMQMAVNVCSKRANIILASQGRLWYSTGKPPWCCLAKGWSVWPLSSGRSSTSGRAPSGLERTADLRSGARSWLTCGSREISCEFHWVLASCSGFGWADTLNAFMNAIVKSRVRSKAPFCLFSVDVNTAITFGRATKKWGNICRVRAVLAGSPSAPG